MSVELFENEYLDDFRYHQEIRTELGGIVLLNYEEFMAWYKPPPIPERRSIKRVRDTLDSNLGKSDKQFLDKTRETYYNLQQDYRKEWKEWKQKSNDILLTLAQEVCPTIGRGYGQTSVSNLPRENFDILVAVTPNYESFNVGYVANLSKKKLNCILGFIIVQLGECGDLRNTYSINLICIRNHIALKKPMRARVLLAAYMYCITSNELLDQQGVLELAGGYHNISGFISYSNVGFVKDMRLRGDNCFKSIYNLPMRIDLSQLSPEKIISIGLGEKMQTTLIEEDRLFLSVIPKTNTQEGLPSQINIATYYDLLYNRMWGFFSTPTEDEFVKLHERCLPPEKKILNDALRLLPQNEDDTLNVENVRKTVETYLKTQLDTEISKFREPPPQYQTFLNSVWRLNPFSRGGESKKRKRKRKHKNKTVRTRTQRKRYGSSMLAVNRRFPYELV